LKLYRLQNTVNKFTPKGFVGYAPDYIITKQFTNFLKYYPKR
jgi:hypothetical protein